MRDAVDLVLCLLPFEKRFYETAGLRAEFVGHPLADAIPLSVDRAAARSALQLPAAGTLVALLPGSRRGEVTRLADDFALTVRWLHATRAGLGFVAPMANPEAARIFAAALARHAPGIPVRLLDGQAQAALIASDAALVASGTATLETALCKRPMVVVYRLGSLTAFVLRNLKLVKSRFFAQPNLLADQRIVGEYFQEQVIPETIGAELLAWLDDDARRAALQAQFLAIHRQLRQGASASAAAAILQLVGQGGRE
jgi:lipid-A-disaccharide synthase